jgi:hypothetical protein
MLSSLRTRFGIPGVISVIALVFAMFGGAYAASNNSGGGKATASAKGPRGPRGKTGPAGPAGPQGPAGAKGDTGAAGSNGKDGTNGTNGAAGTSVTVEEFAGEKEGHCETNGGSKFTVGASKSFACNGKKGNNGAPGAPGPAGDPWTAGGTLPVGSTETGAWSVPAPVTGTEESPGSAQSRVPISFPIPLANELNFAHTEYVKKGAIGANCTGTAENPTAPSGFLCVYASIEPSGENGGSGNITVFLKAGGSLSPPPFGASKSGSVLITTITQVEAGQQDLLGTWAVTG